MAVKTHMSAVQILEQKLKANPQSRVFSRLADTYRLRGDIGPAIALCLEGLAEHPNYVTGRLVLGRCYAEQKNFQAAVEELKKVCVADKRNHAALKMLADIFIKQGRQEEAGGLYRILFEMEPDNPNVKHLSAKHPSNIQGNVFDILGIRPVSVASSMQNLISAGIDEAADIQNMDTIQSETPHTAAKAVHDNTSTILTPDLLPTQTDEPTGSDIENQLDSIFGESPNSMPAAVPQSGGADIFTTAADEPTGSDIENQLDSMFSLEQPSAFIEEAVPENNETGVFSMTTDEPTGSDIENQLDSMFGNSDPASPPAADFPPAVSESGGMDVFTQTTMGMTNDIIANEPPPELSIPSISGELGADELLSNNGEPTGDDIENRLNSLFGETVQNSVGIDDENPATASAQFELPIDDTEQEVSGDDISSRIDELFAQHGDGNAAPDFSGLVEADSDPGITVENDSNLFDFNYTENVDSEINELIAAAQDSSPSSTPDFAQSLAQEPSQNLMRDIVTADSENSADMPLEPNIADESIFDMRENGGQFGQEQTPQSASDLVNGDDAEARLKGLFNSSETSFPAMPEESAAPFGKPILEQPDDSDDKAFGAVSSALFADDSSQNENVFTDELIDSGSGDLNLIDATDGDYVIDQDDVQEKIRQLFKSGLSETETIDVRTTATFDKTEVDEQDVEDVDLALELPDHILTPTLADIYFQQGQPKLSLQIYERLALKDPKDPRLQSKIQEIKDFLDSEAEAGAEPAKKKTR